MDLRQFQDRSQVQANIAGLPPVSQETSAFEAVAGAFGQLAPTIGSAVSAGNKQAAIEKTQQDLGSMTLKLTKAQQASQTDPNFDLAKAQRKIFQETVAANPSLTEDYIKTFKSVTGIEPAGMSEGQKQLQKDLSTAQSRGFGDPNDPIEVQMEQLDMYLDIQREATLMEHEAKKEARDEKTLKKEVYKRTANLVGKKTDSLNLTLQRDLEALANGADRATIQAKWAKLAADWHVEVAQYGEFAADETVVAQLKGIQSTLELGAKMVSGDIELEASKKESDLIVARQKAIIANDPEAAPLIAASELFKNQPTLLLPINTLIAKLMSKGPSDVRDVPATERETGKATLTNMVKSADPVAIEEAQRHVASIGKHLGRNGEDYTDEEILQTCSIMAVPEVFNGMSNEDRSIVEEACATYAVDVGMAAIRDIEQNSSIRVPNETVTPRGTTVFGEPTVLASENFSSLEVDENGFRYVVSPTHQNNRQAQRMIQQMNRNLDKVNPVLSILSQASGKSMEEVAGKTFGLGPRAVSNETPEQPVSLQDRLTQWYDENLGQPTQVATEQEREAQARQIGQSFMDFFMASPEEHLSNITGETGEGTVLAPEQPTEAPVSAPTASPVDNVVNNILGVEGVGDDVTDVPTGIAGITPAALAATGRKGVNPNSLSQEEALQVAREYTTQLDEGFSNKLEGYDNLSPAAKEAILDTGYNLGPKIANFPSFKKAVAAGDETEAMKQLLDTANANGKSLRGIARRRAHNYNKVADVPIATVEQMADGTLRYLDANDNVIFSYKARGGRHADSGIGRISVN